MKLESIFRSVWAIARTWVLSWRDRLPHERRFRVVIVVLGCLAIGMVLSRIGQDSSTKLETEMNALRNEVIELREVKQSIVTLERDLLALKKILYRSKLADPPVFSAKYQANGSELDDPFLGSQDAPVVILAFMDYECGTCVQFVAETLPKLKKHFIDSGQVKYILRDFPLKKKGHSYQAAVLAHCAGEQGRYWEMHDVLFRKELNFLGENVAELAAEKTGTDKKKLSTCYGSRRYEREIQADLKDGGDLGAKGAPGFLLSKRGNSAGVFIRGAQPFGVFEAELLKLQTEGKR